MKEDKKLAKIGKKFTESGKKIFRVKKTYEKNVSPIFLHIIPLLYIYIYIIHALGTVNCRVVDIFSDVTTVQLILRTNLKH